MERNIKFLIVEHNFPEDIVEDILSRLPVKSLLKFRCVSKLWRSLIDSERFIKIHLKKSRENDLLSHHRIILNPVLSSDRILKMLSWASLLEEPTDKPVEFDEGKYIDREVKIVGCCDGLVCLVQDKGRFILWNPATRMCFHLPYAHIRRVGEARFAMYGFGYVESSDDYKVFVIVTPNKRKPIVKVYSLKSNSWKTLEKMKIPCVGVKAGVFVSENLHWLEQEDHITYEVPGLYSFDLKNEKFGMVDQSYATSAVVAAQTVGVIDGCLCVLCDYHYCNSSTVWVMKKYGVDDSWVRLCSISNFNHRPLRLERVQSFCKGPNGEVLLIFNSVLMIYQYNTRADEFRCSFIINIDKVMGEGVYVESLVSLGPNAEGERF